MDEKPHQAKRDRYDQMRRIERLPDGRYYAHQPVWTARLAVLRTNSKSIIASTTWCLFAFYWLVLVLLALFLWLVGLRPLNEWGNYAVFTFVSVSLGLLLYLISRNLVALKVAASYREVLGQLYATDLGRLLADDSWHRLIMSALADQPWYKHLLPQPARTFEQQLESAALYCGLLSKAAQRPTNQPGSLGAAALHHGTSSACGIPAALACCLLSALGSCLGLVLFVPASIGIAGSVLTRRARLLAICDFLLEEVDPAYAQGWAAPVDYGRGQQRRL